MTTVAWYPGLTLFEVRTNSQRESQDRRRLAWINSINARDDWGETQAASRATSTVLRLALVCQRDSDVKTVVARCVVNWDFLENVVVGHPDDGAMSSPKDLRSAFGCIQGPVG